MCVPQALLAPPFKAQLRKGVPDKKSELKWMLEQACMNSSYRQFIAAAAHAARPPAARRPLLTLLPRLLACGCARARAHTRAHTCPQMVPYIEAQETEIENRNVTIQVVCTCVRACMRACVHA